jgi:hypothetical protein
MVQAILEGRKTQTRRIIKKKYSNTDLVWHEMHSGKTKILVELQNDTPAPRNNGNGSTTHTLKAYQEVQCPYNVGDVLWVRETSYECMSENLQGVFYYKATMLSSWSFKWKPSIFMPKKACRIFLKIKSIRVERLQTISASDSVKEGVLYDHLFKEYTCYLCEKSGHTGGNALCNDGFYMTAYGSFKTLWQSINGKDSWNDNPFVWVYEFEQIEKPNDFI